MDANRCDFFLGAAGALRCGDGVSTWPGIDGTGCGRTWAEHYGQLPEWAKKQPKKDAERKKFET